MKNSTRETATCAGCGHSVTHHDALLGQSLSSGIADLVAAEHPGWTKSQPMCKDCINRYRADYVRKALEKDRGELSEIERQVVGSLEREEMIAADLNKEFDAKFTYGQRLADRVAAFGGSWSFIILFGGIIVAWVSLNGLALAGKPFDPFPFILLNLVLSCLAALQAPVIMMSQNRQEAKDRLQAENDYKTNLKAELEVRQLHDKLDHLLTHQMERLMEVQEIQMEMIRELGARGK